MKQNMSRLETWLSLAAAALVLAAAATGVFHEAIYKDEKPSFATQAVAQDFVTALVGRCRSSCSACSGRLGARCGPAWGGWASSSTSSTPT